MKLKISFCKYPIGLNNKMTRLLCYRDKYLMSGVNAKDKNKLEILSYYCNRYFKNRSINYVEQKPKIISNCY